MSATATDRVAGPMPLRFRHVGTRLAVMHAALFGLTFLLVAGIADVSFVRRARASARAELTTSATLFDRLAMLRMDALATSADLLARGASPRAAHAAVRPTLAGLRRSAHADAIAIVTADGAVAADADARGGAMAAALPIRLRSGARGAILSDGRDVYLAVTAPIAASGGRGRILLAQRIDAGELRALERLSAVPLSAAMLRRDTRGRWVPAGPATSAARALAQALAAIPAAGGMRIVALPEGPATMLVRPLPGARGAPEAALLVRHSRARATAAYRGAQTDMMLAGVFGLLLVTLGSRLLARGIARPIAELDAAACALARGERTEVAARGADEIGRLADSFNRMSAGIVERERRIAQLAFNDPLSGLPNRVLFRQQLDAALAQAARRGERVAVLYLDLDGFKTINETLGHPVGDALLRAVGAMLRELAPDGLTARLGGDEFAIILRGDPLADRTRALAQTIIDALRQPLAVDGHDIATGTSIGIAIGPEDGTDPDTLLKNADLALYRAKQDGRGVSRFFKQELDAAARRRRQIEIDLRDALAKGQLQLHYQPIFDLRQERIGSVEALLRWEHPVHGSVSPAEFIPVAEETGLIVAIGEWVLHEACRQAAEWPGALAVAVNVSPLQFRSGGFASVVLQALARSGILPGRLEIEITESIFLAGADETVDLLHRLRALGVRIALDDFGTGYSSLSYLRSFPFDKLKIDRSFVVNVAQDEGAAAIVRAIVALADALRIETTAEGVEDEAQLAELRAQGCGSIQGYLFSRPVPAAMIAGLLGDASLGKAA